MSSQAFNLLQPGVQKAIWSMGWREFHPIQVEAIQKVLAGTGHLIISAQTAGGKTEAAFLPVISQLASDPRPSVQALYVGPLKALINDQFRRLETLCGDVEIPVHRWHGDVSASQKKELRQSPAGILLITPESLESNFINYGTQVPRLYRDLAFVVIDELHSFLDNVRGVHLRSLLSRLSVAAGVNPRIIGLSATLGDPAAACRFLSPDNPEEVSIITDPNSSRDIKFGIKVYLSRPHSDNEELLEPRLQASEALELAERLTATELAAASPLDKDNAPQLAPTSRQEGTEPGDELDEIASDVIRNFTKSTNLIFVNAKRTIEILAVKLRERVRQEKLPTDPFVVHHGSISKELRADAEAQLKDPAPTTAICSSTLEMGIDIGGVKTVGQVDVPWSVASMVQRLGRSGRGEGEAAVMRMYVRATSPYFGSALTDLLYPNLLRAIALTRLMVAKWLEPTDTDRLHLSTLVHQILSCLKQTGGASATQLYETLVRRGPFRRTSPELFQALLRGLGEKQIIEQVPQGDLILAPLGEKITSSFDFYAAFKGTEEFLIRNGEEHIGNLPADLIPPVGESLILAGRRWRVEEISAVAKTVFVMPTRGGKSPNFLSAGGATHTRVLLEMRAVLRATDEPAWLDQEGILLLRAARAIALVSGLTKRDVLVKPHHIQWFPWIGSRGFATLRALAKSAGISHEYDDLSITYALDSSELFFGHLQEISISAVSATELAGFMPVKAIEKFDDLLPSAVLDVGNAQDRLDLAGAREAAQQTLRNHFRR